jgi:hypothetical protein
LASLVLLRRKTGDFLDEILKGNKENEAKKPSGIKQNEPCTAKTKVSEQSKSKQRKAKKAKRNEVK